MEIVEFSNSTWAYDSVCPLREAARFSVHGKAFLKIQDWRKRPRDAGGLAAGKSGCYPAHIASFGLCVRPPFCAGQLSPDAILPRPECEIDRRRSTVLPVQAEVVPV